MKKELFIGLFSISNFLFAQNVRVSNDIIKYDATDVAKIINQDDTYTITSLDGNKSFKFEESKGKLVNGEVYYAYKITDLKNQKSNDFILYNPVNILGKKATFVKNFTNLSFKNKPHTFISEYGFNAGKIENLINKDAISSNEVISKKNDSIQNKIQSILKEYNDDQLSITFDNKIKRVINGSKVDIGRIERIEKTGEPLNYRVYFILDNKLDLIGFYSRSGFFNTNFLKSSSNNGKEIEFNEHLIISDDQMYRLPFEDGSYLPLSKDPNAKKIVAFVYNKFKNKLDK